MSREERVKGERRIPGADPDKVRLAAIQGGTFGAGGVGITQDLPYLIISNGDSGSHVFTFSIRGQPSGQFILTVTAGNTASVPTLPFSGVTIDSGGTATSVGWAFSDVPINPSAAGGTSSSNVSGLPFVTVGPAGATYPASNYGGDYGAALNAAGAYLKAHGGGTIQLPGGVGTFYPVKTMITLYNTVNYLGDGVCLQNANSLPIMVQTDQTNCVYSSYFMGITLDGNAVPGSTVLNVVSAQCCTFIDLLIQNNLVGVTISVTGSPFTYTNSTTVPQIIQLNANGATIASGGIVLNGVTQTGITGANSPILVLCVMPSQTLVVTYSVATPIMIQCAVGLMQFANTAITQHDGYHKQTMVGNEYTSLALYNCQVGAVWSGVFAGGGQVTDNVYTTMECSYTASGGVADFVFANNCDSNTVLEFTGHLKGANMMGFVFNAANPVNDQQVYYQRIYGGSFDSDSAAGQIGVAHYTNTSKPNLIDHYQPNAGITTPVALAIWLGEVNNCRIKDEVNFYDWVRFGNLSEGGANGGWSSPSPASGVAYPTSPIPFAIQAYMTGGTVSALTLGAQNIFASSPVGLYTIPSGQTLTITWSGAPTFKVCLLGSLA